MMRPLKPYLVAVSGLITALFSAVFLGAQHGPSTMARVTTTQPDLQSKSAVSRSEVVASREAKPASKIPASQLDSPTTDFPGSETLHLVAESGASVPRTLTERIIDRRALSLVGIVELRI